MRTQIETIPIKNINPDPRNPRVDLRSGDPEYDKLKASIEAFGCVELLIFNKRTQTLISGHQRLKVLMELGHTEADVVVVDLPLEKEKALNLAMNRIQGRWDEEKLAVLLEEIIKIPDFDFSVSGFDLPDISEILDRKAEVAEDEFDFDSSLESIVEPITKPGDIIQLGNHRIACGDSTDLANVARLMEDQRASLVVTDPPYRANYCAENRPTNKRKKPKWASIANDNLSELEHHSFLKKAFSNMRQFMVPGASAYIWNGFAQFGKMSDLLTALGFHIGSILVWMKPSPSPSFADYQWACEFCCYAWLSDASHRWFGPPSESNVWQCGRDSANTLCHPSQKPIELAARAMRNSSVCGDIILDPFLGSGSVLIAAESLSRKCYGFEIDPRYVDAIVKRFIAFVGKDKVSPEIRERYFAEVFDGK